MRCHDKCSQTLFKLQSMAQHRGNSTSKLHHRILEKTHYVDSDRTLQFNLLSKIVPRDDTGCFRIWRTKLIAKILQIQPAALQISTTPGPAESVQGSDSSRRNSQNSICLRSREISRHDTVQKWFILNLQKGNAFKTALIGLFCEFRREHSEGSIISLQEFTGLVHYAMASICMFLGLKFVWNVGETYDGILGTYFRNFGYWRTGYELHDGHWNGFGIENGMDIRNMRIMMVHSQRKNLSEKREHPRCDKLKIPLARILSEGIGLRGSIRYYVHLHMLILRDVVRPADM